MKLLKWLKRWIVMNPAELIVRMNRLERGMKALQALDVGWKERSKIVIIASIGGKDIVKIIDINRDISLSEYIKLSKELEEKFSIRTTFVDLPSGANSMRELF